MPDTARPAAAFASLPHAMWFSIVTISEISLALMTSVRLSCQALWDMVIRLRQLMEVLAGNSVTRHEIMVVRPGHLSLAHHSRRVLYGPAVEHRRVNFLGCLDRPVGPAMSRGPGDGIRVSDKLLIIDKIQQRLSRRRITRDRLYEVSRSVRWFQHESVNRYSRLWTRMVRVSLTLLSSSTC